MVVVPWVTNTEQYFIWWKKISLCRREYVPTFYSRELTRYGYAKLAQTKLNHYSNEISLILFFFFVLVRQFQYIFLKVKYICESLDEKRAKIIIFSDLKDYKILEDEKFRALASSALLLNCAKEFIVIPFQLKMYHVWYVIIWHVTHSTRRCLVVQTQPASSM